MPTHAPKNRDDVVYARCFSDKAEGHYLYKNKTVMELKPGTCGYFDDAGDWQEVADLTRPETANPPQYKFIPGISAWQGLGTTRWEGRVSTGMKRCDLKLSAGGGQPGVASAETTVAYSSATGEGAILMTDGDVTFTEAGPETSLCNWMIANGKQIIENNFRAKEKGLWIVTKTYSVPRARNAVVKDKDTQVALSIKVEADRFGKIEGGANWWRATTSGSWNELEDPQNIGVVVAFDGIYWKDRWYSQTVKPVTSHRTKYLGGLEKQKVVPITFEAGDISPEKPTLELVPVIKGSLKTLS